MNYWLLILPFTGALLGWLANSLILRLIFYPVNTVSFLGIRIQGILPKMKQKIARGLGEFASRSLSFELIEQKMRDPVNFQKIEPVIEKQVDEFLRVKLGKEMPMVNMFIGDKTIDSLKKIFMQELGTMFPLVIGEFAGHIKSQLEIGSLVTNKISSIPDKKLKQAIMGGLSKPLQTFRITGALTGFIIGALLLLLAVILN